MHLGSTKSMGWSGLQDFSRKRGSWKKVTALVDFPTQKGMEACVSLEDPGHERLDSERLYPEEKKSHARKGVKALKDFIQQTIEKHALEDPGGDDSIPAMMSFFSLKKRKEKRTRVRVRQPRGGAQTIGKPITTTDNQGTKRGKLTNSSSNIAILLKKPPRYFIGKDGTLTIRMHPAGYSGEAKITIHPQGGDRQYPETISIQALKGDQGKLSTTGDAIEGLALEEGEPLVIEGISLEHQYLHKALAFKLETTK
jgi:hypothetical protein